MKRNLMKSAVSLLLAGGLLTGLLASCGGGGAASTTAGTQDKSDKPATWIADRTITIQAYVDDIGNSLPKGDINETPVMKEITKRTGIKLKVQYTPGESDEKVLAAQLASGTIPDVVVTYLNNSTRPEFPILLKAAREGMFADVSGFMKDSQVYKKYLEPDYLPDDSYKNISFRKEFDGKAYIMQLAIPAVDRSLEYNPTEEYRGGMYIQSRIVKDLGIDPRKIVTQDQLYDLLVKIKAAGYKDDHGNDIFPLGPKFWGGSVDSLDFVLREYNWGVSKGYNIDKDGNVKHEAETDYVFKKINFIRRLLAEGLMNPEFFTMDETRANEVSYTKNSGIIADVHNYQEIIYGSEDWVPLGYLNNIAGDNKEIVKGKRPYGAWAISSKAKNPEEIFKFFDYLSTEEGQLLCQYGIEGVSYKMVDGKPHLLDEVVAKLDDTEWLVNNIGAGFGGSGSVLFDYIITDIDAEARFGESRPGSSVSQTFARSVQIAKDYPYEKKLVKGLDAPAYLTSEGMEQIKAQMDLLNYNEVLVQAMYANSEDEAKKIIESFRAQLKAAGIEEFEKFLKDMYAEDKDSINFYQ